ncbi:hypothetical protein AVEN_144828-1 [Araneus ventricosus]|uniref:DUF4371 domain-containing protein n=1 Tax=Araneus ventricosus TaxID=182803 RepID=A0A4Y2T441_ARAVE|nr:hypothetical protein AVEN_144828-1 [Araneus ventricosus]
MPKRSCKFTEDLQNEFAFLKKVCTGTGDQDDRVKCSHCNFEFSVAHGVRSDIKDHFQSSKHKKSLACAASSSKLTSFFKTASSNHKNLDLAAKECEAIVLNVIAPLAQEELKEDLAKSNFVSVSVQVKLLDFKSVAGETSEILTNHLCSVLFRNDLNNKVVGFCGDNCNTNFGGVKRAGQKNVFHRLKNSLGREINGIGCGAHIVHNCVQTTVDSLSIDIEAYW